DGATRRVKLHFLRRPALNGEWSAFPDLPSVAVRNSTGYGRAVDLATSAQFPGTEAMGLTDRARAAWERAPKGSPPHTLPVFKPDSSDERMSHDHRFVLLGKETLYLHQAPRAPQHLTPLRDGQPLLPA